MRRESERSVGESVGSVHVSEGVLVKMCGRTGDLKETPELRGCGKYVWEGVWGGVLV